MSAQSRFRRSRSRLGEHGKADRGIEALDASGARKRATTREDARPDVRHRRASAYRIN